MCSYDCRGTKQGLCDDSLGKQLLLALNNSCVCLGLEEKINKYSQAEAHSPIPPPSGSFSNIIMHGQKETLFNNTSHADFSGTTLCIILL